MIKQQKSFFARNWGWFAGGAALLAAAFVAGLALLYLFVLRGNARVTEIALSNSVPVFGEGLKAEVTVENTGFFAMDYRAVLTVDGKEAAAKEVELERDEPRTLELDISDLTAGSHVMSVGGVERKFKVFRPAAFEVTGLTVEPETIMIGETVLVRALVSNTGEVRGVYTAQPLYDGMAAEPVDVTVGREGEQVVEFNWIIDGRGEHTVSLGDLSQTFTALAPANIAIAELTLSEPYVEPNEVITATVALRNSGDLAGTFPLRVAVNGEVVYLQDFEVPANGGTDVPVQLNPAATGPYDVTAGDLTRTFHVVTITQPKNGAVLVKTANGGYGRLHVENNYGQDAVVVLAGTEDPRTPLLTVYVHANSKAKNIKVKDGTYYVFFSSGEDWDSASNRFMKGASYGVFDNPDEFKTTSDYYYRYYSVVTITLKSAEGSSPTTAVLESDFPH